MEATQIEYRPLCQFDNLSSGVDIVTTNDQESPLVGDISLRAHVSSDKVVSCNVLPYHTILVQNPFYNLLLFLGEEMSKI